MPDLTDYAEALERLADGATPGPWEWVQEDLKPHEWGHAGPDLYSGDTAVLMSWGHDADGLIVKAEDMPLIAQSPALARSLAAVSRELNAIHQPVYRYDDDDELVCSYCTDASEDPLPMPCPTVAAILAALAPLAPLLPAGAS